MCKHFSTRLKKNQSVYGVSGTSRCLISDKYKTYKYSLRFLKVKLLDSKLSPGSECCMLSSGKFPGPEESIQQMLDSLVHRVNFNGLNKGK